MLKARKKIAFTGESIIDNKVVCVFTATIESDDPKKMTIGQGQRDKEAYIEHRAECRADYAEFEDAVISEQKKLLEEAQKTDEE